MWGDVGEIEGRCRGDVGEVQGRYTGDMGEIACANSTRNLLPTTGAMPLPQLTFLPSTSVALPAWVGVGVGLG